MRQLLRFISIAMLLGAPLAAAAADCRPTAIEQLRAAAPEGFAIYQKIQEKKFFAGWISCGEPQFALPTAVHESVHYITAETDAFPLTGVGQLKRPHEVSGFFAPSRLAALMAFVALYVERAQTSEPATWAGLQQPRVVKTISDLWGSAETVMASS